LFYCAQTPSRKAVGRDVTLRNFCSECAGGLRVRQGLRGSQTRGYEDRGGRGGRGGRVNAVRAKTIEQDGRSEMHFRVDTTIFVRKVLAKARRGAASAHRLKVDIGKSQLESGHLLIAISDYFKIHTLRGPRARCGHVSDI